MQQQPLNRIAPQLPARSYDTYEITAPRSTHRRLATCVEAGCAAQRDGWVTVVDERTELGARQATYIRGDKSRGHVESRTAAGWTAFTFAPGNTCFAKISGKPHTVTLERDPIFVVARGDWRGMTNRRVVPGTEWLDRFGTNQESLKSRIEQG